MCDWLLLTRTECWQRVRSERSSDDEDITSTDEAPSSDMLSFQEDLASLRKLASTLKAAIPRVGICLYTRFELIVDLNYEFDLK